MITLKKIVSMVRTKQNDNNEIKYSDYDIINAVNECIRYVNSSFALKSSDFLERIHEYRAAEINAVIDEYNKSIENGRQLKEYVDFALTGVDLPDGFVSLVSVIRACDGYHLSPVPAIEDVQYGTYKVFGNKIFCHTDFNILYRGSIPEVYSIADDSVDLPDIFLDLLVKLTGTILNNNPDTDVMMQEINSLVDRLIPKRRYTNMKRRMPFYC